MGANDLPMPARLKKSSASSTLDERACMGRASWYPSRVKKKSTARRARADKATRFGPHPDDAREARLSAESAKRGDVLSTKETYALLDEMLGEPFPRPSKKLPAPSRCARASSAR